MDAAELEKKINATISFILNLGKSTYYLLVPFILIRKLQKKAADVTAPYTFLTILAFFGLRIWHFFFLKRLVDDKIYGNGNPDLAIKTEQTTADKLRMLDFIGIPSWEDILMLTIPYIITAAILAKGFRLISQRLKIDFKIAIEDLIIYYSGFLIIALPLILIFTDFWWNINLDLLVLSALTLYLFLVFRQAVNHTLKAKHTTFLLSSAVMIPVITIASMYGTLWSGKYLFSEYENTLSEKAVNKHVSADLFQVKLIDFSIRDQKPTWKILLRSNDTERHSYQLIHKPGVFIYNEDSVRICSVEDIKGEMQFSADEPTLLEVITTVPDKTCSDYYFADLCIVNRTAFKVGISTVLIWKLGKKELFRPQPKSTGIFAYLGKTLAAAGPRK